MTVLQQKLKIFRTKIYILEQHFNYLVHKIFLVQKIIKKIPHKKKFNKIIAFTQSPWLHFTAKEIFTLIVPVNPICEIHIYSIGNLSPAPLEFACYLVTQPRNFFHTFNNRSYIHIFSQLDSLHLISLISRVWKLIKISVSFFLNAAVSEFFFSFCVREFFVCFA